MTKYCPNCGAPNEDTAKFCVRCGSPLPVNPVNTPPIIAQSVQAQPAEVKETVFYKGEGELVIRKMQQRSTARKVASWLTLGPIGYVAFGRDKKSKTKAEGELIVTNKAIYCAGNDYPFDRLLSITRDGKKVVVLTFEKDVAPGGQGGSGKDILGGGTISIEAEIKMKSKEACDELFLGLQHAKTSHLQI